MSRVYEKMRTGQKGFIRCDKGSDNRIVERTDTAPSRLNTELPNAETKRSEPKTKPLNSKTVTSEEARMKSASTPSVPIWAIAGKGGVGVVAALLCEALAQRELKVVAVDLDLAGLICTAYWCAISRSDNHKFLSHEQADVSECAVPTVIPT